MQHAATAVAAVVVMPFIGISFFFYILYYYVASFFAIEDRGERGEKIMRGCVNQAKATKQSTFPVSRGSAFSLQYAKHLPTCSLAVVLDMLVTGS